MLEVLIYLFANFFDGELDIEPDRNMMIDELTSAGFEQEQIERAFQWLQSLPHDQAEYEQQQTSNSFRVYLPEEMMVLSSQCRGLLHVLEQAGILNSATRELVIDYAMQIDSDDVSIDQLKWIILITLLKQSEHEEALDWLVEFGQPINIQLN